MTKDEIIEMAREAGFFDYELDDGTTDAFDKRYETFAKMVAEKERKACIEIMKCASINGVQSSLFEAYYCVKARGQAC